jgi:septal ring factor EnvC (AmiA/AmiB activator)
MSSEVTVAIISSGTTLLGSIAAGVFAYRKFTKKFNNTSMVNNYQTLYMEMRKDIGRIRDEQREERKQWAEERKRLNSEIADMRKLLREQDGQMHEKDIKVTELTGKIETLTVKLQMYEDSSTVVKTPTTTKTVTVTT